MAPRGNGRGGPMPRKVQVSKKLSWLLRHGAEKEGLVLNADGYVGLASVLANRNIRSLKVTFEEVQQLVKENDKQRFGLVLDPARCASDTDPATAAQSVNAQDWLIRANQGHSIKMESTGGLLKPITKDNMPAVAVHGTTHAKWSLITESGGLKPMGRNHVHFAVGLPAGFRSMDDTKTDTIVEAPVISGMRTSSTVLMYLDVPRALDAGLELGLSENNVILTSGDADGLVPLQLFSRVEDRSRRRILLKDGQLVI